MNDHLIGVLLIVGLRLILNTKEANIIPTPTATPAGLIEGILEAG